MATVGFSTRMFLGLNLECSNLGFFLGSKFTYGGMAVRLHIDESGVVMRFKELLILPPNIVFLEWGDLTYSNTHTKRYLNPFELRRCRYQVYESKRANLYFGFNDKTVEKYADIFIGADKMPPDF